MASDAAEKIVMLPASNKRDALDYECPRTLQRVSQTAPGRTRPVALLGSQLAHLQNARILTSGCNRPEAIIGLSNQCLTLS